MEENIRTGAWRVGSRRGFRNRVDYSGNRFLVRAVVGAALLIGGVVASDRLTRAPIDYHGVSYRGYHISEGQRVPIFEVEAQGKVPFRNDDEKFDCDGANRGSLYDVHGYRGWLSGNVATNISPTKVNSN